MKSNETQRNTIVTKTACLCALLALGDILRNINPYIQVPSLAPIIKGYPRGYPLIIGAGDLCLFCQITSPSFDAACAELKHHQRSR